jgi:hypothetical protein
MVVMGIFHRLLAANRIDVDLASEDRLKKRNSKARPMAQGRVSGLCAIGVIGLRPQGRIPKAFLGAAPGSPTVRDPRKEAFGYR